MSERGVTLRAARRLRHGVAFVGAFALAALVQISIARADCVTSVLDVTCSGNSAPFDAGAVSGYNFNVLSGAVVQGTIGTPTAIQLIDNNVVTNRGTLAGFDLGTGLAAGDGNQITNFGTITSPFGYGIWINDNNTVVNNGLVQVGDGGTGINSNDGNTITNTGTIIAGVGGIGIAQGDGQGQTIRNDGTITVGANGTGISATGNNVIINNGTVTAGANGYSIASLGGGLGNTITNNGTLDGLISNFNLGTTLTNNGLITITDPGTAVGATHLISLFGGTFIQSATGILALRVDNAGAADNLFSDTIQLGGMLKAVVQPGLYSAPITYLSVLSACVCGLSGTFATGVTASSPFFTATAAYDYGLAVVDLTLTRIPFGSVPGMTDNQRAVGNTLEANYSPGVTGNAATLYSNLFAATSVSALDQLSGAGTSATQGAAFLMNNAFMGLLGQGGMFGGGNGTGAGPLGYASAETRGHPAVGIIKIRPQDEIAHRWQTWVAGFGATRSVDGDAAAGIFANTQRGGGAAAGLVYRSDPDLALGAAVGVSQSHFAVNDLSTSGDLTTAHLGAQAAKRWGALYAAAAIAYARIDSDTTRTITGVGPTEIAKGSFAGDLLAGRMEIGWRRNLDRYVLTPFAAVQFSELWQRGYSETSSTLGGGPGVLGLSYTSQAISSLPTTLGAQIDSQFALENGLSLTPYARLAWLHEFRPDSRIDASFVSIPGTGFTVAGTRSASDAARIDSGLRLVLNERAALTAGFTGELSAHSQAYAGTGGLQVSW